MWIQKFRRCQMNFMAESKGFGLMINESLTDIEEGCVIYEYLFQNKVCS